MINKFEAIGIFVCIGAMSLALFFMRVDSNMDLLSSIENSTQTATVVRSANEDQALVQTLADSMNAVGDLENIIIDDVVLGTGEEVQIGDTVSVHYIGTLQDGQQFDNSYVKGSPLSFALGTGKVIRGWDEGIVGMKKGGQRILVIPPEFAYGTNGFGPIPPDATLVFAVELVDINK